MATSVARARPAAAIVLALSVAACSNQPAAIHQWVSEEGSARFGARLEAGAPEWVPRGSDFELDVTLSLPEKPNGVLRVADKMFLVVAHGCRVNSIGGQTPRRGSEVLSGHAPGPDEWSDDYVPAEDGIVLDNAGQFQTRIAVTAAPETGQLGVVRSRATKQVARGCRVKIWNGVWASVEPEIEVR